MRIIVVGTGYVGLVTAACFAELGHTVTGVDIDPEKIAVLQKGKSTIFEPQLEEIIQRGLGSGRLQFTTDLASVLGEADVVFSAVATPPGKGFKADLHAVFAVAETVGMQAEKPVVFVNKSTVPVGTGKRCEERIDEILQKRGKSFRIHVVSNPEFLREGTAVPDTLTPDRVIVGINSDEHARAVMTEIYRPLTRTGRPLLFMSRESAEIVKYASNSYLATRISFINMLTEFTETVGGNIRDVAAGMGLDHRIGHDFLHAGIGYGGSCFPKDVKALLATAEEYGVSFDIISATDAINARQRTRFFDRILTTLPKKAVVCLWGLSFKPNTDDMRDAPSLDLIPRLQKAKHIIAAYDPAAMETARKHFPTEIRYATSPLDAAKGADAIILLTEWDIFRGFDLAGARAMMRGNHLFDGRNIYDPEAVQKAGLVYHTLGVSPHL